MNTRVLVVDDNETNRRILEDMLTNWRMQPRVVNGGPAALAAINGRTDFPLIIVDAFMPEMDGFELVARIRQRPEFQGAAIMMLSSAGLRGDAAR